MLGPWKKCLKRVRMGPRACSLLVRTMPPFLAEHIFILIIFSFRFFEFQISRFLDFQIPGCQAEMARAQLRDGSAVAPDHKVGEIQGTRAIPSVSHQCKHCSRNKLNSCTYFFNTHHSRRPQIDDLDQDPHRGIAGHVTIVAGSGPTPSDPSRAAGPDQKSCTRQTEMPLLVSLNV